MDFFRGSLQISTGSTGQNYDHAKTRNPHQTPHDRCIPVADIVNPAQYPSRLPWRRRRTAHRAGDMVSAMTAEISVETTVIAMTGAVISGIAFFVAAAG